MGNPTMLIRGRYVDVDLQAAETCMCLGNVSSTKVGEAYFRDALLYLQEASKIPNYTLSSHFQQYVLIPHSFTEGI